MMSGLLYGALRAGVHTAIAAVVTWLATHGLNVPVEQQGAWEAAAILAVTGVITTTVVRLLESRNGDSVWAKAARGLARLLMLGLTGKQPVYVAPDQRVRVVGSDGVARPPR
jgi:hypothetical protein